MVSYSVVVTGPLGENCYLLWKDKAAWILDPGADADEICAELEARALTPCCIVLTHGHFDHLGALDELLNRFPALPVVMREEEDTWCFTHPMNQYPPFYMHQKRPATVQFVSGETISFGGITATAIPTPGHTPGGQCILVSDDPEHPLCFTGDTLFQGSIGRTDLPGGSFAQLNQSLQKLREVLPEETTILSGHGPASTMARELRLNPYLQSDADFL